MSLSFLIKFLEKIRDDYGSDDNGVAIDWYWTSRDEPWGDPYRRKNLKQISLDYEADNAVNTSIGYTRDSGSTFTNKTTSLSGTGINSRNLFINGGNAYDYRLRIRNNSKGETATITGITGWAELYKIMD